MSFESDIKIKVQEVFSANDGFILICDYFDDSVIKKCLQTRVGSFFENNFSVAAPTSCFSPLLQRAIHIRTDTDLTKVKEILFRNKEIEELDCFEGIYIGSPESHKNDELYGYDVGALFSYLRKNKESPSDLTADEMEQFRIKNEKKEDE